jgi:hypothetical protein
MVLAASALASCSSSSSRPAASSGGPHEVKVTACPWPTRAQLVREEEANLATGASPGYQPAKTRAAADATKLLATFALPPGATLSAQEPAGDGGQLQGAFTTPVTPNLVDDHRFYVVSTDLADTAAWFVSHVPPGATAGGVGSADSVSQGAISQEVTYTWPSLDGTQIGRRTSASIVPLAQGGSAIRLDAQETWQSTKSAAQQVPRDITRITIAQTCPALGGDVIRGPIDVTAAKTVAALRGDLDALKPVLPGEISCPAGNDSEVLLELFTRGDASPAMVVDAEVGGCSPTIVRRGSSVVGPLLSGGSLVEQIDTLFGVTWWREAPMAPLPRSTTTTMIKQS